MTVIITVCTLLLLAYVFDLTSAHTRVPSVIFLLILGFAARQLAEFFEINIPDLRSLLPIFGNVGLILIVLEGSLELELNKTKTPLIGKAFIVAVLPMAAMVIGLSFAFQYVGTASLKSCLINAIPLCIISSAIAIPSVKAQSVFTREFVIYESSLSDIVGVLLFNFIALNESFGLATFGQFGLQVLMISVISFVATIGLAFLLNKIDHHIKFAPIILLVILIYAISKEYHLPALLFIMLFGLFLGNIDELKQFKWIQKLKPVELNKEVHKFKELTIEGTFLVRALFFLLFGYLIETHEILNTDTLVWAITIVMSIFLFRAMVLALARLPIKPLLFVAPRGLITILLFLAVPVTHQLPLLNKSLIIQIILLTALVMMFGLMYSKPVAKEELPEADV